MPTTKMTSRRHRRERALSATRRAPVFLELIVPARNEERRIAPTIARITEYLSAQPYEAAVVVVDNGSVDRTPDVVDRGRVGDVPVHVIGCSSPGKGAAVRRGVLTGSSTIVGYCDADLSTPIEALELILPQVEAGFPVVVGSRRAEGSLVEVAQPVVRRMGSWAFHQLTRRVTPDVRDTQCGFKFFHGPVARQLFARARVDGFAFDVEILGLALQAGLPVAEVPVPWDDVDGSTFRVVRDGMQSVTELVRLKRQLPTSVDLLSADELDTSDPYHRGDIDAATPA